MNHWSQVHETWSGDTLQKYLHIPHKKFFTLTTVNTGKTGTFNVTSESLFKQILHKNNKKRSLLIVYTALNRRMITNNKVEGMRKVTVGV
jgi:hypothetical protein